MANCSCSDAHNAQRLLHSIANTPVHPILGINAQHSDPLNAQRFDAPNNQHPGAPNSQHTDAQHTDALDAQRSDAQLAPLPSHSCCLARKSLVCCCVLHMLQTRLIKGSHFKEGSVVSHVQRRAAEQVCVYAGFCIGLRVYCRSVLAG